MIPTIDHPVLCTSLAQSKALQEVGIDPKTADMTWVHSPFTPKCAYGEEHYMPFCCRSGKERLSEKIDSKML